MTVIRRILAVILAIMALFLIVQGVRLIMLGGSLYYAVIGLAYLAAAVLAWRSDARAGWITALAFLATLLWAYYEVGSDYWGLFPRLMAPLGVMAVGLLLFASRRTAQGRWFLGGGVIALIALVAFFARGFVAVPTVPYQPDGTFTLAESANTPVDWTA